MTKQACELRIWLRQPGHGHGSHGHGHGSHGSGGSGGSGGGGGGGENGSQWRGRPLRLQLPVGAGQISLADMDSDGLMDLVFLSPHPQGGARGGGEGGVLHVWYGALWRGNLTQADAEAMASTLATPGSEACRKAAEALPPEILCSSAEHARLAFVKRNWTLPAGWVPLDAAAAAAAASSSASSSSAAPLQRPPTLGVADFLSNGYPELLLPLLAPPASATPATGAASGAASGAGSGADPLRSILAAPSRCAEGRPCIALLHNDRELRCSPILALPVGSSTEDGDAGSLYGTRLYPLLSDTIAAAFFDLPGRLEDDSSLDILARLSSGGHKAWRRVVDSRANYDLKVEATPRATYYLLLTTHSSLLTTYLKVVTTEASCKKLVAPAAPPAQPWGGVLGAAGGGGGGGGYPWSALLGTPPPSPPATPATPSPPSPPSSPPAAACAVRGAALMSGLNLPGVSYQFYTTLPTQWDALVHPGAQATWGQERQARAGSQLPQSAYAPLLMPYVHFGLGQTTDYVEDLTVSSEQ